MTTNRSLTIVLLAATIVFGMQSSLTAATVTWNLSAPGPNEWNTTAEKFTGDSTTYSDGDTVWFRSDQSPVFSAEAVFIGLGGSAVDVAPGAMIIAGQRSGTWTFSGGDITGSTGIQVTGNCNRPIEFQQNSLSFTGGTLMDGGSTSRLSFQPPAAGPHQFGTDAITINTSSAKFRYEPQVAGSTLTNNFVFGPNGGTWQTPTNGGVLTGTVTMQGGQVTMDSEGRTLANDIILEAHTPIKRSAVSGQTNITGNITSSGGPYDLELGFTGGANPDWRIQVTDANTPAGGWDIRNLVKTDVTNGTLLLDVDETDFFNNMTANGGRFSIDGGRVQFQQAGGTINVVFPLDINDDPTGYGSGLIHNGALTLNVTGNGEIGGDGIFRKHTGMTNSAFPTGSAGQVTIVVDDGGSVAPGQSIGTMTIWGDLVLGPNAELNFEFAPGGVSDQVVVMGDGAGNLTLDGVLNMLGSPILGHTYTLFTYEGTLIDNGLTLGNLPYRLEITDTGSSIEAMWIPEPGSGLILLLATGLIMRRRRVQVCRIRS